MLSWAGAQYLSWKQRAMLTVSGERCWRVSTMWMTFPARLSWCLPDRADGELSSALTLVWYLPHIHCQREGGRGSRLYENSCVWQRRAKFCDAAKITFMQSAVHGLWFRYHLDNDCTSKEQESFASQPWQPQNKNWFSNVLVYLCPVAENKLGAALRNTSLQCSLPVQFWSWDQLETYQLVLLSNLWNISQTFTRLVSNSLFEEGLANPN